MSAGSSSALGTGSGGSSPADDLASRLGTNGNLRGGRYLGSVVDLINMQKQLIEQLAGLTDAVMDRHAETVGVRSRPTRTE